MLTFVIHASEPRMCFIILESREDVPGQDEISRIVQGGAAKILLRSWHDGQPIFVLRELSTPSVGGLCISSL